MSKQQKLSDQVDSILSNRNRRFKYLMRKGRMEDAIALGDEFFEWLDPDQMEQEETLYYNEEELVDLYQTLLDERLKKKKKRGRKNKNE